MHVVAYDPYFDESFAEANGIRRLELDELLREADFVTLHLFLDESTRHLIDASRLAMMKPDAVLINTARGGIIEEDALVDAVRDGAHRRRRSRRLRGRAAGSVEPAPAHPRHPRHDARRGRDARGTWRVGPDWLRAT